MKEIKYIVIPNELLADNDLGQVRVIVYSFFCYRRGMDNLVAFTVRGIAKWCGKGLGKNVSCYCDDVAECILKMVQRGYFLNTIHIENGHEYPEELHLNPEKFDLKDKFTFLYQDEIDVIRQTKEKDYKYSLLLLLAYVKSRMYHRNGKQGKVSYPECFYHTYQQISNELRIPVRTVSNMVEVLVSMEIIIYGKTSGKLLKDKQWHSGYKVFASKTRYVTSENGLVLDASYDPQEEIRNQIKLLQRKDEINLNDG